MLIQAFLISTNDFGKHPERRSNALWAVFSFSSCSRSCHDFADLPRVAESVGGEEATSPTATRLLSTLITYYRKLWSSFVRSFVRTTDDHSCIILVVRPKRRNSRRADRKSRGKRADVITRPQLFHAASGLLNGVAFSNKYNICRPFTEKWKMVGTWWGEIRSCSCLAVLPGSCLTRFTILFSQSGFRVHVGWVYLLLFRDDRVDLDIR